MEHGDYLVVLDVVHLGEGTRDGELVLGLTDARVDGKGVVGVGGLQGHP